MIKFKQTNNRFNQLNEDFKKLFNFFIVVPAPISNSEYENYTKLE